MNDWSDVIWFMAGSSVTAFFGWFFYWLSVRQPRLEYTFSSRSIVDTDKHQRIEIRFDNKVVSQVSQINVRLWNATRRKVEDTDIPRLDPIRVSLPENVKILSVDGPQNMEFEEFLAVQKDPEVPMVSIAFSYLAGGACATTSILHDGSEGIRPEVTGTVKGGTLAAYSGDKVLIRSLHGATVLGVVLWVFSGTILAPSPSAKAVATGVGFVFVFGCSGLAVFLKHRAIDRSNAGLGFFDS